MRTSIENWTIFGGDYIHYVKVFWSDISTFAFPSCGDVEQLGLSTNYVVISMQVVM